ncbi:Inner centromere protein-related protein pic1 OS=Schizosaccharomyces pombe (strain 972 / ATCC 24843) GN=pic1 PE=1 SV=2 [Rhizoctonia solani AG-1 IB]|uniref:Inner centromere protein-related protein pic1 n=1 Tax=Thanatephorus cucumeris (strain AG1-IB / isolate 7/3/14) TaxID=1108050 RepID=A0A0B7FI73_THACB|nr:Inner centromere protein-related protein pic1 OS=Schizosaccharomyces pombe (strain 972 / ATCC 24843) GN=pic1 PE=1 SV=2 [Rhizoctonia solani AG-1 IB]
MSVGFAQWASAIRNRMAADPGRADFKDQVQCNGYLFLHEYLDDVLNAPRLDNVIELTKTPGRNKTASKKARALHASAQKIKPVAPIAFGPGPKDKENDASATSPKQPAFKPISRSQPNHPPEPIPTTSGPRDSIARATPARAGVPVFSPANRSEGPLPTPSDDPLSPFRDATTLQEQQISIQTNVTAQQIFTTKLVIAPSSPAPSEKDLPTPPAGEPAEPDLSIIQEDDEGQSIATFEDAREHFTDARSTTTLEVEEEEEGDVTEIAELPPAPAPAIQRLPSPPASEDTPTTASEPPTPVREPEHEPTEPITNSNVTIADVFDNASTPVPTSATAPAPEPSKKSSIAASQPTPPPEPALSSVTSPRPLPIPPSRGNSGSGTQQPLKPPSFSQPMLVPLAGTSSQPLNPPRASSTVPRGPFAGPSLKELRREPSVSGNANRELRQSSWRKKPDGTGALTTATSTGSATTDSESTRLKRKSSALQHPARPPPPKSQKLSHGSSHSSGSSSEDETEMQIPLKDEDGGSWNTGTSMLDDLRNRLARLEKSTSGKTPAASRIWTPTTATTALPNASSEKEKRLSLSDLSLRPASGTSSAEKGKGKEREPEPEPVVGLDLGLSTGDPAASTLSNRSTTPVDSPPQTRRVLPAPPVFSLPALAQVPKKTSDAAKPAANTVDAVRAAKAEAARLFGGTKFTAPPARTETQSTLATEIGSVFDKITQSQFTQSTAATQIESQDAEMEDDLEEVLDLDPDVDVEGDDDMEADEEDDAKTTSSRTSSTKSQSAAKKGPAKGAQSTGTAKKAADEQDRKASRLREMEERRQAAALRKAEEEKSRTVELEKKRKEREELAKSVKAPVKKVVEDPNKKRKVEAESKAAGKKPAAPSTSTFAQSTVSVATTSAATKSRIAKPTATAGPGPSALKSALKSASSNPFQSAPPASTTKTLKSAASSSSLKAAAAKKAKGSISDAPGQALQQQMHARVQAQLKAAQKEPEIQSESIELPDINSEYSDSDDEDRGKDFPSWTQDQALLDALKDQEKFNPDALFGPIQPLKMGDLFKTGHSRFRKRTSSANWAGTDGITVEEEMEYARRMGYINQ